MTKNEGQRKVEGAKQAMQEIYICLMSWGSHARRFPRGGEVAGVGGSGSSVEFFRSRRNWYFAAPYLEAEESPGKGGQAALWIVMKYSLLESAVILELAIGYCSRRRVNSNGRGLRCNIITRKRQPCLAALRIRASK